MRPLRYTINVTLDGCVDHRVGIPDEDTHNLAADGIAEVDALILGRVTYEMMEQAWRPSATGDMPKWMEDWMIPFAQTIDAVKKYVVSDTLDEVDWNAELIRGKDLGSTVQALKEEPGEGLGLAGVKLAQALANLGLIDEYEFVVHPVVAGHGPRLLEGLREPIVLTPVSRREFTSGVVATRYRAAR